VTVTVTVTETVAVARAFGGPGQTESGMGQAPGNREDGIEQGQAGVTVAWSTSPQAMATAGCERSSPAEPAAIR